MIKIIQDCNSIVEYEDDPIQVSSGESEVVFNSTEMKSLWMGIIPGNCFPSSWSHLIPSALAPWSPSSPLISLAAESTDQARIHSRLASNKLQPLPAFESKLRLESFPLYFPGTKWCGVGDVAKDFHDLGPQAQVDRCCRVHDHCPIRMGALSVEYGTINLSLYTRYLTSSVCPALCCHDWWHVEARSIS